MSITNDTMRYHHPMMLHIDPRGVINMFGALLNGLERRGISREDLRRDWKLAPNWVSYGRIVFSPLPMILLLVWPDDVVVRCVTLAAFVVLAATDWVDGHMARRNDGALSSEWGAFIDPIGDKLLVAFTLVGVLFALWDDPNGVWLCLLVWLILAREFVLTAQIRIAQKGITKPTLLGKAKTMIQMVMIGVWILPFEVLGLLGIMIVLTIVFTIASWHEYYKKFVVGEPA